MEEQVARFQEIFATAELANATIPTENQLTAAQRKRIKKLPKSSPTP